MTEKSLFNAIKFLVFIIVVGAPLFYFPWGVYPYTLSKTLFFQAAVEILFFLWLALVLPNFVRQNSGGRAVSNPRYRPKPTPLLVSLAVFLSVYFLVSLNGIDFWKSFWSTYERGIGFFAMLHFAALALVLSSLYKELPWRKIFYSSLATSVIIDAIAYVQIYIPNLLLIENPGSRPGATFGNPGFMSGYLLFNIFLSIYLLFSIFRESKGVAPPFAKIFFIASAGVIDVAAMFLAQTRGDILALVLGLLTLLFLFCFVPPENAPGFLKRRSTYLSLIIVIVTFAAIFFLTKDNPFWAKVPGLSRFSSVSFSGEGSIAPRFAALRAGWQGFLKKPVLGWGPENFMPIYDRNYDPKDLTSSYEETRFDKPHNLFLEYLDSGGIILFAAFIFLFGAAIYESIRQKDKLFRAIFLSALVSYGVSQFFLFETIGTTLMLYLFFGAADGGFREKDESASFSVVKAAGQENANVNIWSVILFLALAAIPIYKINFESLRASLNQYYAFQYFLQQKIFLGLRSFEKSVSIWSPYSWNFKRDYAIAVAGQYFNYPGTVADEDVLKAVKAMEETRDEHPADAFNHYALVNIYNEVADINKNEYTAKAEKEAEIALKISPRRQEALFLLAKTKTIKGDYAGALSILKGALEDNPKVADAHFYYGIVAFATGDKTTGYNEVKTAISMGREWKTFYEARTAAGFFADSGHIDEALELYKTAWGMSYQSDLETEIKLGVIYFFKGQRDVAKTYLEDAVKKFDVAKSPSYAQLEPILKQLGIKF